MGSKQIDMFPRRVFHFSGGRSSAMMVMMYYQRGDLVIFCDTGREHPDTYRFVGDFEKNTDIPVIVLRGDWRREVIEKEKMIPNRFKRKCTIKLKIVKARRYLRSIGWFSYIQFIGFRNDEKNRIRDFTESWQQVTTEFPLNELKIKKSDVVAFWHPLKWKLQIASIQGNCDLCFLKGQEAVMYLMRDNPALAEKWIQDEEDTVLNPKGYTYMTGITYRELLERSKELPEIDLHTLTPKHNCICSA